MKEVSCKALGMFFRRAQQQKIPVERLLAGIPYSLSYLQDKHERIEWTVFTRFMENASRVWSDEELIELGGAVVHSPFARAFSIVARLWFSARDVYRFINRADSGAGNQLFACIKPTHIEIGPNHLVLEMRLPPGYPHSRAFWLGTKGGLTVIPQMVGLKPATVELEITEWGARYDIVYPKGGAWLAFIVRFFTWPFLVRSAGRELQDAHDALGLRYRELKSAKDALAVEKQKLDIARNISNLILQDLDLARTLDAVAAALVEAGRFTAAEVRLDVEQDGQRVRRVASRHQVGEAALRVALDGRGRSLGELLVERRETTHLADAQDLLVAVAPVISTAIENALAYKVVADLRASLEEKVLERTAELRQTYGQLQTTVNELQEAQAARDRIFANINHEIRTPLSLIKMAVHALRHQYADSGRASRELDAIEFSNQKLLRLVDTLLLLASRLEQKLKPDSSMFDLAKLLAQIVSAWQTVSEPEGLRLEYEGPDSCAVILDESLIERAVSNLVSNAVRFTPAGGAITVRLVAAEKELRVTVRDTGLGLPPDFKSRIFGRFEQGDTAPVRGPQGSGLGLSLVKDVVDVHDGRIEIDSPAGGGTAFELILPRRKLTSPNAPVRRQVSIGDETASMLRELVREDVSERYDIKPAATSAETILVAEDDPGLRMAIGNVIGDKYRTIMARDGYEALQMAKQYLPDLLVTDVQMPLIDGFELVRQFQLLRAIRMPSAILLTAYANLTDRLEGLSAGAIDYIIKPFDPAELMARIESQLALRRRAIRSAEHQNVSALDTLVKGLMHELRNPANGIVHSIGLLREQLPEEVRAVGTPVGDLLEVAATCANQIESSCRDLLGTTGRGDPARRHVPFGQIVDRARSLLIGGLGGVTLTEPERYDGTVYCSDRLIAQVLANLIKNGAQAAGRNGWVKLSSRAVGDRVVIEVRDSGPGVAPELRERIFQLFFTTKDPGEGTGLGLYMSRQIVMRHEGVLEVRDTPEGSAFCIELPIGLAAAATTKASAAT